MQGLTFLEKTLFSSYTFNASPITDLSSPDETASTPSFQINLFALLETLQIFGLSDAMPSTSRNLNGGFTSSYAHNAFNAPALALAGGTCRISYPYLGAPLSITISEAGVTTTCDLNTYESSNGAAFEIDDSIPLQRDALTLKIILRSMWLYDAIIELASTNPTTLILTASTHTPPLFAFEGAGGPFGDSSVDFQPEKQPGNRDKAAAACAETDTTRSSKVEAPMVSETFTVLPATGTTRVRHRYKFQHIQKAARAMALASKVCIRCDAQGVLSLQFMIELSADGAGSGSSRDGNAGTGNGVNGAVAVAGATGQVSFVDFRFVPLVDDDNDDEEEGHGTEEGGDDMDGMGDEGLDG